MGKSKTVIEVMPKSGLTLREMPPKELMSFRDEWQHHGNCHDKPALTNIMFAERGFDEENAKNICNGGEVTIDDVTGEVPRCPVKNTCLVWARLTKQPGGIWGGVRMEHD